jgi:aspartate kinase
MPPIRFYLCDEGGKELPPASPSVDHCGKSSGVIIQPAKNDCPAILLTGTQAGIITSGEHNNARILRINPEYILKNAREGKVVVVTGFQGVTEDGEITTLGRGGSDTTAAALGVALNAASVDIYTDVDGIMTADPRIVAEARPLETVTYNEICQLAREGAKVVHPRAVEIAAQKSIPLRVKCTFSDAPGTLVTNERPCQGIDITGDRTITGITHIQDITQFRISTKDGADILDFQRRIFKALALAGISVDFITQPEAVLFTIKNSVVSRPCRFWTTWASNRKFFPTAPK